MNKIPEGTQYIESGCGEKGFRKYEKGCWWFFEGYWRHVDWKMGDLIPVSEHPLYVVQPDAWNGEGLPPAGAECEVIPHNTQWGFSIITPYHCTILAYHDDFVWLDMSVPGVPVSTRVDKVDFRPIRTADQIAADEREAGIAGIRQTLISNAKGSIESAIWDAGYRKQVAQ